MQDTRPPLVVPDKYYEAIGHLATLGPDAVGRLSALANDEPLTIDVADVAARFSKSLSTSSETMLAIFGLLMSLNELRWERQQSPESLENDITAAIEEQGKPEWKAMYFEGWKTVAPQTVRLLLPNGFFSLLRKAYDLALNRQSLVGGLQILTDARPLFDESASSLRAFVLSHALILRVHEGPERRALHITLDAADMERLRGELERATTKEATLRRRASECNIPIIQLNPR